MLGFAIWPTRIALVRSSRAGSWLVPASRGLRSGECCSEVYFSDSRFPSEYGSTLGVPCEGFGCGVRLAVEFAGDDIKVDAGGDSTSERLDEYLDEFSDGRCRQLERHVESSPDCCVEIGVVVGGGHDDRWSAVGLELLENAGHDAAKLAVIVWV